MKRPHLRLHLRADPNPQNHILKPLAPSNHPLSHLHISAKKKYNPRVAPIPPPIDTIIAITCLPRTFLTQGKLAIQSRVPKPCSTYISTPTSCSHWSCIFQRAERQRNTQQLRENLAPLFQREKIKEKWVCLLIQNKNTKYFVFTIKKHLLILHRLRSQKSSATTSIKANPRKSTSSYSPKTTSTTFSILKPHPKSKIETPYPTLPKYIYVRLGA